MKIQAKVCIDSPTMGIYQGQEDPQCFKVPAMTSNLKKTIPEVQRAMSIVFKFEKGYVQGCESPPKILC